jgi:hypothetical protein
MCNGCGCGVQEVGEALGKDRIDRGRGSDRDRACTCCVCHRLIPTGRPFRIDTYSAKKKSRPDDSTAFTCSEWVSVRVRMSGHISLAIQLGKYA